MDFLKRNWQNILIVFLIIFGMNKCASSCSNSTRADQLEKERIEMVTKKDSIISVYDDSIKNLNMRLQVLETTISGNKEMIDRLSQANEQISAAKKNINVNVRSGK